MAWRNEYDERVRSLLYQMGAVDVGNIYWVIQSSKAFYRSFVESHLFVYPDGSKSVYTDSGNGAGIQAAISACKGGRNDFIIVGTGNYNLTAAITLAGKSSVHLVALNAGGYDVGALGAAALTQTGNYPAVQMEAYGELTGFQIINKNGYNGVYVPAASWRCNIHHNYFHMVGGSDIDIINCAEGNANSYGRIHHNKFTTWVAGVLNSAINKGLGGPVDVCNNEISCHNGMVMDYGIINESSGGMTNDNDVSESGGDGAVGGGTITVAVQVLAGACAIGNRCAVGTGQGLAGGTASHSFVDNRDGQAGGATPIET